MADLHIKEHFKPSDGGVENTKPSDKSAAVHKRKQESRGVLTDCVEGLMFYQTCSEREGGGLDYQQRLLTQE